jgi:glycosyltransferase involved in cell wall biosynthesis
MASDHPSFEVVVIDNASGDGTDRAARRFASDSRVRFTSFSQYLGLGDNWRRAMDLCQGEFVKLVCADDLIHPTALSKQAAVLRNDPSISLVASRRHLIDAEGYVLTRASGMHQLVGRHTVTDVARQIVNFGINPIGEPGSAMFRRADYEAVGGWDAERVFNMDIDLFLRILGRGDLYGMRESLAAFRVWTKSLSSHHDEEQFRQNLRFVQQVRDTYGIRAGDRRISTIAGLSWAAWDLRRTGWSRTPRLWSRPLVS